MRIEGGRVLWGDGTVRQTDLGIAQGRIADTASGPVVDASGLLVLPGIVDIHGDAFERQVMPRPGVAFDLETALIDTDRQLVTNGITTALHAVTVSWEPGLRSNEMAVNLAAALGRLQGRLACDTRLHVRWELFNLDAVPMILGWIDEGRVGLLAFNDHTPAIAARRADLKSVAKYADRTGMTVEAFSALVDAVMARAGETEPARDALAAAARAARIPLASHDDTSPAMRRAFRDLGVHIAEFPTTEETTFAARAAGDHIIFGAPNVLRGGSHINCPSAGEMVARDACSILASDYYYPALHLAPFRLVRDGACDLAGAWSRVSAAPAAALGLADRGSIAPGKRADLVLVDDQAERPAIVGVLVEGRFAHLSARLPAAASLAAAAE